MTDFDQVLEDCLDAVEQGDSSVDECLSRYPEHARVLEPILLTSAYLERGRQARLSDAFKKRVRTRLITEMAAHPRKPAGFRFPFLRLAAALTALVLALIVSGTVYAQRALPGEMFYSWKLASEHVWRAVSPDPVNIDLALGERRASELIVVRNNAALYPQALSAYLEIVARLKSELDSTNQARILSALDSQMDQLRQSGVVLPQLNQETSPVGTPAQIPTQIPTPTSTATPLPILPTLQAMPTNIREVIPTIQVPIIKPTVPKIRPTIEIPPPIP